MIVQKKNNAPVWKEVFTCVELPEKLKKAEELAYNLWWSWNPQATNLFERMDPDLWFETDGNPIKMLRSLSLNRIDTLLNDTEWMQELDNVHSTWQKYMSSPGQTDRPSIAYFSMEYGLTHVLKIYSGGLGVLAGDYLKEASDSNVPLTAVGFLYRYGYFDQRISADGQQLATYDAQDFHLLPIRPVKDESGYQIVLEVPFSDHTVYCHVWQVKVGRIDLFLMDTDLDKNSEADRQITHNLYGGDWENRMKQEYLLGIGGILLLQRLGIKKEIYHMNEGHAALINAQRLADSVEQRGLSFDIALEAVRSSSLYTVHTPVPAGHDYFDEELLGRYMGHFPRRLGISWQEFIDMGRTTPGSNEKFSMSVFALNTCQEANGVSYLHGVVSRRMFAPVWPGFFAEELHVGHVTNGVHLPTWASPESQRFYEQHLGTDFISRQAEESAWEIIEQIPSEEIWELRSQLKENLLHYIAHDYRKRWLRHNEDPICFPDGLDGIEPDTLLIGFARRFATYKRAHLLFTDLERLSRLVNNPERPVRFLYAGKAHPADGGGQGLIKHITEISRRPEFRGKIIFLENYDMHLASKLIAGVDVWLNTPTRPLEASGTSGQKAEMNGVLNFSVQDGWWYEGYRPNAGWALTDKPTYRDQQMQDKLDALSLYDILEREIIPLYYDKEDKSYSEGWIRYIRRSMMYIAPHFTMKRMLDDYYDKFYGPLAQRHRSISASSFALASEIADWKQQTATHWDEMRVVRVAATGFGLCLQDNHTMQTLEIEIEKGNLSAELNVELVVISDDNQGGVSLVQTIPLNLSEQSADNRWQKYNVNCSLKNPGLHRVAIRITPHSALLPHKMDFAYVRWAAIS